MSDPVDPLVGRISHLLQQAPLQSNRKHDNYTRRASVAVILRLSRYPDETLRTIEDAVCWCESAEPFVDVFFIKRANSPNDQWSGHVWIILCCCHIGNCNYLQ